MSIGYDEIRVRGRATRVPKTEIHGRTIVASGRWLKVATVRDEELVEGEIVPHPDDFVAQLRSSGLGADIFTFPEALGAGGPAQPFPFEPDNAAIIRTNDFEAWWNGLPQESRKNARRAAKRGVVVRTAELDDQFATGIKRIYDESPVRQGKPFWHYGKDLNQVKMENGTYPARSEFIGAYHEVELIGFMKWIYVDDVAWIIQILALSSHYDKRPMNAMIAKAVEICHQKSIRYLVYSRFTYGNKADSSLAEFKRRLGFEQLDYRRYYVPLTLKGRLALKLGIHRGWIGVLPSWLLSPLLTVRARWFGRVGRQLSAQAPAAENSTAQAAVHPTKPPGKTCELQES
jgi:hypothetical protein